MGFFRWLFGLGQVPAWADSFERREGFDAWVDAVLEALSGAGYEVTGGQARSGSVRLRDASGREHEVMLQDLAELCARIPPPQWPDRIEGRMKRDYPDLFGDAAVGAPEARGLTGGPVLPVGGEGVMIVGDFEPGGTGHLSLVGTGWGGVYLVGQGRYVTVWVFPVGDASLLDALGDAKGPADLARLTAAPRLEARAVVVCNHTEDGVLHGSRIARQLGARQVFATDPTRPIDRGVEEPRPLVAGSVEERDDWPGIELHRLDTVAPAHRAMLRPGLADAPVVIGVNLPYDVLTWQPYPGWIVGSLSVDGELPDSIGEALLRPMHALLVEDGSGAATAQAEQFGVLEIPVTLLGGAPEQDD